MRRTKVIEEKFFRVLMFFSTVLIASTLLVIILSVFYKGLPALSWQMLTQTPQGGFYFGRGGGILNAILGSLYLGSGATLLSVFTGLPLALYINVHLVRHKKCVNSIRFVLDLLWGVPSIVYGAFGFAVMTWLGIRVSLIAGTITVTLFIIPVMVRAMDEVLKSVPRGLLESALSLGSTRSETAYRVYFRQCLPGLSTAVLLSFGRAIGDAASILFTAGFTDHLPTSLTQPAATLPLSIFFQLSSPIPQVQSRAYASAVVLVFIILATSLVSRFLGRRYDKNSINF